ncbi:MAG: 30S ribosomal protein S12 methylthiotransferase RimO [Acidobacteriota bacterium]
MRLAMVQLGCPKNWVDGEWMLGQLQQAGHEVSGDLDAETVIVNTCGFIDAAKEESIRAILEVAERKKGGRVRRLLVAGCLVERYKEELRKAIPEIDGFIPLGAVGQVARLLTEEHPDGPVGEEMPLYDGLSPRILATPPHLAYVKIAEGCDNPCSFCPIPSFRGAFRSRPLDGVVAEVQLLAQRGVKEVVLVAQDTTDYGRDLGLKNGLALLLHRLEKETEVPWIRFLYAYPNHLHTPLLEAMARCSRVVPYLDLPLQHAHPDILRAMKRGGSGEGFLRLLERARKTVPGLAVRSTFIVGFPGERREHFQHLLHFLREARLDHAGVFTYSREEGTGAHRLGDPVDPRTKRRRQERLLEVQQEVSFEKNRERVGTTATVLVEGAAEETEHLLEGRLATQAPDVDGRVLINDGFAPPGTFAKVRITEAHPYDLVGGILGPA